MSKFYLKKLTISGEGKNSSFVEFGKGLNIVHGLSDTGKTCIVKCIDFVFGSKDKEPPVPVVHGYSVVELLIETENGSVTLERKIGKTKVKVSSTDPNIPSGEFPIYNANGGDIAELLLPLIGITDKPKIIKNSNFERIRLTWRNLLTPVLIDENEILQPESILMDIQTTAQTSSLSALLYLIEAPDFSKIAAIDDKKIREARRRAVEKYIGEEIDELGKKKAKLDELLKGVDPFAVENTIQGLVEELSAIEARIAAEVAKSKGTLAKIFAERDRLDECDLLLRSYAELRSQYAADIKRLSFIVDGEVSLDAVPAPEQCPYCNGAMPQVNYESYIEASNAELSRIVRLLEDLAETEKSVKSDRSQIETMLKSLSAERADVDAFIKNELQPKAQKLRNALGEFRAIVRMQNEFELLKITEKEKVDALHEMLTAKEEKFSKFKPRDHFPGSFEKTITSMFESFLSACKYENFVGAIFSLKDFDFIVNAKAKASYGKGYRAFLNAALAIVMREYLCKHGKFAQRLLVLDSPLLSLKQNVDDAAPDDMKSALLEYLMKNQSIGQTIIVENNIPDLPYDKYGVKLLEFTKGKTAGRHGLLADVHD